MRISDWSSDVCSSGLVDLVGQVDEPCEVTGAHHGCLVTDDHRAVGDAEPAVPDVAEELGDGVGGDAAVGVQAGGRPGGEGAADDVVTLGLPGQTGGRSEEHTSELQSLMRISYAAFCLKKKKYDKQTYS